MKVSNIDTMTKGWFIGNFSPSCLMTQAFECALKEYKLGEREKKHYHKIATEFTVIVRGTAKMNGIEYSDGSIIEIAPLEATDFEAVTDVITMVVKVPAVIGDKYESK